MRYLPLFLLVACKPPAEAPEELDELVGFLFEHFEDEDSAELEAGVANLDTWLIDGMDETREGYSVNNVTQEAIDGLENVHAQIDGNLAGAAVGYPSVHSPQMLIETTITTPSTELYPDSYTAFDREYLTDPDCFIDDTCERLDTTIDNDIDYTILQVEVMSQVQYRRVAFERGDVIIERTWLIREPVISVDWLQLDAQLFFWALLPDEDGNARSLQATWFVYTFVDTDIDEDLAVGLVIDSMAGAAENLDQWILDEEAGLHDEDNTE
ncbi:MAG: hypothetical protein FJ102_04750 [Deltaproteobacteria bacterium]|nr:hypothetical protein [Deltaproteobacteria bacterium]